MEGTVIGKHFELKRKLGNGAFGEIWEAIHVKTQQLHAVKFEDVKAKHQQLYLECKIYLFLHSDSAIVDHAFPQVSFYGCEREKNFMVMDLLGPSLEDLFGRCNRKFSLKTCLMIADQALARLEYVHARRVIHRDVKPDNFAVGVGKEAHRVFVFDFGLAKKFMNADGNHIQYLDGKGLTGTARYASVNTHRGVEQSRRDDLESLAYVLIYFMKGALPWQNIKARNTQEKYNRIRDAKADTKVEVICEGLPEEFATYLTYCRSLAFNQKPDYKYAKDLFKGVFRKMNFTYDYVFDWSEKKKSPAVTVKENVVV